MERIGRWFSPTDKKPCFCCGIMHDAQVCNTEGVLHPATLGLKYWRLSYLLHNLVFISS
jgi:hypothetical protein